jgi:hypothetical protein
VPAVQPYIIEPVWEQFRVFLLERKSNHPLGRHRLRIPDRVVFEKLVEILVFGCAYWRIADEEGKLPTRLRGRVWPSSRSSKPGSPKVGAANAPRQRLRGSLAVYPCIREAFFLVRSPKLSSGRPESEHGGLPCGYDGWRSAIPGGAYR